jgi:uncharacterized membrane protein
MHIPHQIDVWWMNARMRLWEIDCARGVAILMMIVYHTVFDLAFFSVYPVQATTGFWRSFAFCTASLFLLIAGVSLVVSRARAAAFLQGFALTKKFLMRGTGIFALGLLVTFATWLYLPDQFVVFGILHLIGVSVAVTPLFVQFGRVNIALGTLFLVAGPYVAALSGPAFLLPLGIMPPGFASVDYTPLVPWLGMVLIGMGAGEILYAGGERRFALRPLPDALAVPLSFLGRHSLVIYLVHQPVILLLLALFTGIRVF